VIDAVGAAATRAAASRMMRPGGVIVHLGLLPGNDGLDVRKITLQEIIVTRFPADRRNACGRPFRKTAVV
jgi:L-iditol 2-dehydrogenase